MKEARVKHVTSAMSQQLRLVVRPNTKSDYIDLLKESALIQNRSSLSPAHSQEEWRHAWIYDSGSDNEPQISAHSQLVWSWASWRRRAGASEEFVKVLGKLALRDDLHVNYK